MLRISPPATPSMTTKGLLLAETDVAPRTCNEELELGLAAACVLTFKPATFPDTISIGLFIAPKLKFFLSTCTMELETSFLLNEP